MNIQTLIDSGANVSVMVNTHDLREFALHLIDEVKRDEAARLAAEKEDEKLSPKEVAERYNLSICTLWRWAKCGYLQPIKFGRKSLYRVSEIEKLLNKKV